MASVQYLLSKTLKPLRVQKAYKEAALFHDWETVVGKEFAKGFLPAEIYPQGPGKILKLITSSSGMATARYVEPAILERVNRFFGATYIASIKTVQGQIKQAVKKSLPQLVIEPQTLDDALQAIAKHLGRAFGKCES